MKPLKLAPPLKWAAFRNQVKYSLRCGIVQPVFSTRSDLAYSICSSCVGASAIIFSALAAMSGGLQVDEQLAQLGIQLAAVAGEVRIEAGDELLARAASLRLAQCG